MKLLVISTVRYRTNGISSVIKNIYINSCFKEFDITFVFPFGSDDAMIREVSSNGFRVVVLSRKNIFKYYFKLKKIMKNSGFDAVQ